MLASLATRTHTWGPLSWERDRKSSKTAEKQQNKNQRQKRERALICVLASLATRTHTWGPAKWERDHKSSKTTEKQQKSSGKAAVLGRRSGRRAVEELLKSASVGSAVGSGRRAVEELLKSTSVKSDQRSDQRASRGERSSK